MEDDLNGRRHIGKNTSIEEYLNGSQPQWNPFRKLMTLVSLAGSIFTELGPAQPQLVCHFMKYFFPEL